MYLLIKSLAKIKKTVMYCDLHFFLRSPELKSIVSCSNYFLPYVRPSVNFQTALSYSEESKGKLIKCGIKHK